MAKKTSYVFAKSNYHYWFGRVLLAGEPVPASIPDNIVAELIADGTIVEVTKGKDKPPKDKPLLANP